MRNQKIYVIEDNCDGWGGSIGGRKLGSFGDISISSFHAAHIVSMGIGGGVFTNSDKLAQNVRVYRDWGRVADLGSKEKYGLPSDYPSRFIYEKIGYNFQILELQAAMGRVQLKKTESIKKARKKNYNYLLNNLRKHHDLLLTYPLKGFDPCWFAFPITVIDRRGELLAHLENHGVETRTMFSGNITKHPAYKDSAYRISGDLDQADEIMKRSLWITCHPRLKKSDLDYIVKVFDDFYADKN